MPAAPLYSTGGVSGAAGLPSRTVLSLLSPTRITEPLGRGLPALNTLPPGRAAASTKQQGAATSPSEARQGVSGNKARSNTASPRLPSPAEAPMRPVSQVLPDDAIPLHLKQRTLACEAVGAVLDNLHPGVRLNSTASADGAAVLGLASPVGSTSFLDLTLCKLSPGRMLACARSKLWWMTPEWRSSTRSLPPETQFLLTELRPGGQGPYALLLPLIDGAYRATLRCSQPQGGSEGELVLRVESGDDRVATDTWQALMHVSVGWDPYALVERGVTAAARLSGGAGALANKVLPPSLDVFGWCTWDAFYSSVSAKGIQDGLRSLHANGVRPRFLIIDDGWQMTSLDTADATRAPATSPAQLAERISWLDEKERNLLRNTDDEFFMESMEVIAEAAKTMPVGTSASTSIPMLSSLGPEGARAAAQHHQHEQQGKGPSTSAAAANGAGAPAAAASTQLTDTSAASSRKDAAASTSSGGKVVDAMLVARVGQKLAGWVVGLGTAAFLLAYQWLVEPAPPNSLPVRTFAALANGPLRGAMLGFYSGASDFTRRLTSVQANAKFSSPDAGPEEPWDGKPAALGDVVSQLKAMFGLQYVYCWHGLPGYWAGIAPDSDEMKGYGSTVMYARPTPGVLEVEPSMAWNPAVLAGVGVLADPTPVYNAMHHYLSSSGVDGVKVDCQAGVGLVGSALGGGPSLSRRFHAALETSIATHFADNHAINCMCHSTENLYRMRDTAVARASDDFYPRDPASSQPHIAACAYNSIFLSALVQPDWDMFHSKHAAARLHAIARAISGGGVYISDKPGEHDAALLRQLVLPDGSLLRCAGPGRPTRDCLFDDVLRDGKSALKVWNVNRGGPGAAPGARLFNGVVAAFNLQGSSWDRTRRKFFVHDPTPAALEVQVRPRDVEAFASLPAGAAATFVARAHGQPPAVLHTLDWSSALTLQLDPATAEMVTLAPISQCGELQFAAVGWLNMLNSGGGITSLVLNPGAGGALAGTTAAVGVRGSGTLLMHASHPPRSVRVCGVAMRSEWSEEYGTVSVDVSPTVDLTATIALKW